MSENSPLKALRDRPFELLAELERRARAVTASAEARNTPGREWVGVALRMAGELYLVAREEAREVLGVPTTLARVPGAKAWILGLANVRGQLLPIIDLRQYLDAGVTPASRNTRVIVANHRDIPAGLLVEEVLGFRRFPGRFSADAPPTIVRCDKYGRLLPPSRRAADPFPRTLLEDPAFLGPLAAAATIRASCAWSRSPRCCWCSRPPQPRCCCQFLGIAGQPRSLPAGAAAAHT
jgi:twitching motility protein PilI